LVEKILADWLQARMTGRPKKYLAADEQLAAGGKLMDLLLPTDKTLGESTGAEIRAVVKALAAAAKKLESHHKYVRM
jgi:hypothetical protein